MNLAARVDEWWVLNLFYLENEDQTFFFLEE